MANKRFRLYKDEKRVWNKKTFTDYFKLEGLGPTVRLSSFHYCLLISKGSFQVVGSSSTVADEMQKWVDDGDVDGFSKSTFGVIYIL